EKVSTVPAHPYRQIPGLETQISEDRSFKSLLVRDKARAEGSEATDGRAATGGGVQKKLRAHNFGDVAPLELCVIDA
ncbi:hypothetical protein A2U01_0100179, partial [Trifolium medium]|nr:hypothetical protein [Trifolium medium]